MYESKGDEIVLLEDPADAPGFIERFTTAWCNGLLCDSVDNREE